MRVSNFFASQGEALQLELVNSHETLKRQIGVPEVHRPGLALAGFLKYYAERRLLVFGRVEVQYLRGLEDAECRERLEPILTSKTPAVILARRLRPPKKLLVLCRERGIPLFRSGLATAMLMRKLNVLLEEMFAPRQTRHGTLVEVFGVGLMIDGDSAAGKSEAALGLVERGHRLVSDDVVWIRRTEGENLEGSGDALTRHLMEIRGVGIIDVAKLYGTVCVRPKKRVEIVVRLEPWEDGADYDRIGLEEAQCDILGVTLPFHVLPVKPGRDLVLLLETLVLNYRLRQMGHVAAQEFNQRLLRAISTNVRKQEYQQTHV